MPASKLACLCSLACLLLRSAVPQAASRQELDAFGLAYEAADPLQKIKACESFLSRYPKSAFGEKIWQLEFEAFSARGDAAAALRVAQRIVALDPHQAEMLAKLASLAASSPDPTERQRASGYASRALEELKAMHRPEEMPRARYVAWKQETAARAHAALGQLALGKEDASAAVRELQAATNLVPAQSEYWQLLGMAQFFTRDFRASRECLLRAAAPTREALLYLMRDDVALDSLSLDVAERAASSFPQDAELQFEIGQAALDHIRSLARQANGLGRDSREFQELAARKQGKPVSAPASSLATEYDRTVALVDRCYQAVLQQAPDSAYGRRVSGYLAESQNQIEEALADYRAAGDHFAAGRLLAQNTRYDEAASEFKAELAARPDNHLALAQLSQLYVQLDQLALARPILEQLLVLYPADAYAWLDKGRIEQKSGHWQAAAASFKKALSIDPTLAQARYRLATAYLHLGETSAAAGELQVFRTEQSNQRETKPQP
jgi:tetratricopeptide (TPR) repeat protein